MKGNVVMIKGNNVNETANEWDKMKTVKGMVDCESLQSSRNHSLNELNENIKEDKYNNRVNEKDKYNEFEADILRKKFTAHDMTTKEKILYASLTLFSLRGYEGVTMRDIAATVNIKGSSIYKHYASKQEIFESIIEFMNEQYEIVMVKMHIPVGTVDEVASAYCGISKADLFDMVKKIFHYYLKDDYASKFRRILVMEQYKNAKIGDLFIKIYYDNALSFQEGLFKELIRRGYFHEMDARTMVLQFYAPIFLLINVYDQYPEKEEEALLLLKKHIDQFYDIYQVDK